MIFDTNALSAFADGDEELLRALENEQELALPSIVLVKPLSVTPKSGMS